MASSIVPLSLLAFVAMNGGFLLDIGDLWTRLVVVIALLGAVGLAVARGDRRAIVGGGFSDVALGLATAAALYLGARVLASLDFVAEQISAMNAWTAGHSPAYLIPTLLIAVAGEELFWRGAFLPRVRRSLEVLPAALVAATIFAVAHVGSGTWLLPFAAFGAGFVWNVLYLGTGNLSASFVSHLVWDLFVVVLAPPL